MKKFVVTVAAAVLVASVLGCASSSVGISGAGSPVLKAPALAAGLPASPAPVATRELVANVQPERMAVSGLPNLHKVNDNLYRGGKPKGDGFRQLKAMGVHKVVDLGFHFWEIDYSHGDLQYVHIPFYTYNAKDAQVVQFLRELAQSDGPVYVHCRLGADRTGFMIAVYRVAVCGWSREKAVDEMVNGGYGFNREYQNLINYVMTRDIAALAKQAGIR